MGDIGLIPEGITIKREAKKQNKKKNSEKEGFIKRIRGGENSLKSKNVLQILLRLEMVVDHKEPVAMETSSLQAMLLICGRLLR